MYTVSFSPLPGAVFNCNTFPLSTHVLLLAVNLGRFQKHIHHLFRWNFKFIPRLSYTGSSIKELLTDLILYSVAINNTLPFKGSSTSVLSKLPIGRCHISRKYSFTPSSTINCWLATGFKILFPCFTITLRLLNKKHYRMF